MRTRVPLFYTVAGISVAAVDTSEVASPSYLRLTEEATRRKTALKREKQSITVQTVA